MNRHERELQKRLRDALYPAAPDRLAEVSHRSLHTCSLPPVRRWRQPAAAAVVLLVLSAAILLFWSLSGSPGLPPAVSSTSAVKRGGESAAPSSSVQAPSSTAASHLGAISSSPPSVKHIGDSSSDTKRSPQSESIPDSVGLELISTDFEEASRAFGRKLKWPSAGRFQSLQMRQPSNGVTTLVQYRYATGTAAISRTDIPFDKAFFTAAEWEGGQLYTRFLQGVTEMFTSRNGLTYHLEFKKLSEQEMKEILRDILLD